MKIINNICTRILAVAVVMFTSCATPLDIEYLDTEEEVVVNAMGNADENLNLRLTYSRWFLSEKPFKEISNATVNLLANGQKVDEGVLRNIADEYEEKKYYCFDNYIPREGDLLKLDIQVPGEEPVSAECRVPQKPQISDAEMRIIDESADYYSSISFVLHDNPNEQNYYMLTVGDYGSRYFCITDYLLVEADVEGMIEGDASVCGDILLFSDDKINGHSHTININIGDYRYSDYEEGITFKLAAITEDMYRFLKGMNMMRDDMQELFGEPVQTYSNIENGIGIFGILSTVKEHVVPN